MILDTEDRQLAVPHPFHRAVVQINMGHFHVVRQRFRIDREAVILRSDCNLARLQILTG
jgi:hypothetical protein